MASKSACPGVKFESQYVRSGPQRPKGALRRPDLRAPVDACIVWVKRVTEAHYNRASSLQAAIHYGEILDEMLLRTERLMRRRPALGIGAVAM